MNRWSEITAVAVLVATLALAVAAQGTGVAAAPGSGGPRPAPGASGDDNSFAIRDVRVFDGERVIERANVIVRDGRIAALGTDAAIDAAIADGTRIVDGRGKTLLPGFVDAHTHSWGSAQADALRFGVTTELDMLGDWNRLPAIAQQRQSLERTAQADLWSAGAAVTAPGGHGTATRAIDAVWKNGYAIERALTASAAPAPATAAMLPAGDLISDFDGGAIDARIGHGWEPTTDQMMGGASTVSHALVAGGAAGSRGALEVTGEIKPARSRGPG